MNGTLTTLHSFCSQTGCTDGYFPYAGLVQATDGNLYGTTADGGVNNQGTVFKISPSGALTTLYSFTGPDGKQPEAALVQAIDGNFYGTTVSGGANNNQSDCPYGCGTVFRVMPSGILTTLYSFCSQPGCADGLYPEAGLVQATDGNLYGTTDGGGTGINTVGTVFRITPGGGILTTLYSFCSQTSCADGLGPEGGLVQGTDGRFYGTTYEGGAYGDGTVFALSVVPAPFVELQPTSGNAGKPVTIFGMNLMGATGVTFNGTPASFQVVSPSTITTSVPSGATTGFVQVTGTPNGILISDTTFQITSPVQFVLVTPCRLVDTRPQNGGGGPIQGGTFQSFNLPQLAQTEHCGSGLSSAGAYSLNVTVVPQGSLGYLTVWPTGEIMPGVSTLNSMDGRVKANAAIVPSGSNSVSVFASNTTDVILDIDGYFTTPSSSTLAFYPLNPCRVADTRKSNFPQGLGTPHLSGGVARDFPVMAASSCNIPPRAQAYSLNFTAVPYPTLGYPLGYLEVWPKDQQPQNPVSTLNNLTGTIVANAAIVPAGTNGEITAYGSSDTDLVIDINGYFAPAGQGGLSLYPVVPCRVLDTRKMGSGQPFSGGITVDVVDSVCGPPGTAQAYVLNATVVPVGPLYYLTLWPDGEGKPLVSTLNAVDGAITSNMAIVPTNNGKIDAFATDLTQLILDISSYFAP